MDEAGDAHEVRGYRRPGADRASRIIVQVSAPLSRVPIPKRRQLAATLGLFAVLFVAVAAVTATEPSTPALTAFLVIALIVAVVLALMGWGVANSVKRDLAEQRLDDAIEQVVGTKSLCSCGHDHDPTELHIVGDESLRSTDDPCARDGKGQGCTHSCDTCVLAALRPRPRPRPSPTRS
jgi:hypothetical protein